MRKLTLVAAAAASLMTTFAATAADAQGRYRYDRQGRYVEPQRIGPNDRVWRGNDGQYYCKRKNGTTGLIVGGAAGALLGREIDGGQNRTLGTVLGAGAGALLGREIDRGSSRCR